MKIAAFTLSAALLAFMSAAPANAMPASSPLAKTEQTGVVHVQHGPRDYRKGKYGKSRYYKGRTHRYRNPPRGWHRYSRRPSFWQTRGCIAIGPVWYCP